MEVHHHPHHGRKKLAEHLWEFLMLFLAVFCGFLAENQREHFVEHQREKQYIRSLISDLKTDTTNITQWLSWYNKIQKSCDTVLNNFDSFKGKLTAQTERNFYNVVIGFPDFIYTDRTIQQLKNSGGMRLIKNAGATDSIIAYDAAVRDILIEETGISMYYDQLNDLTNKMRSYRRLSAVFKTKTADEIEKEKMNFWIKPDDEQFEYLYNLIYKYKELISGYTYLLNRLKRQGKRLIVFLQKEYHFE